MIEDVERNIGQPLARHLRLEIIYHVLEIVTSKMYCRFASMSNKEETLYNEIKETSQINRNLYVFLCCRFGSKCIMRE